jgi:hypothetical protein
MSFLKRTKKQNTTNNQPNNNDPNNQDKATAKAIALKTFGNKAAIQQLATTRCDTSALPLDRLKLDALKDFPLNPEPKILHSYGLMTLQLQKYAELLSAYLDFAKRCVGARCPALFWRYQPRIKVLVLKIQREVLLKNAEVLFKTMETMETKDRNGDIERLKAAQELVKQITSHIGASIMDEIEKQVPRVNMEELKAPILEGLDKQLFGGTIENPDDFFKDFMKRHDIDTKIFEELLDPDQAEQAQKGESDSAAEERLEKWRKSQKHLKD